MPYCIKDDLDSVCINFNLSMRITRTKADGKATVSLQFFNRSKQRNGCIYEPPENRRPRVCKENLPTFMYILMFVSLKTKLTGTLIYTALISS